jgi:hypothetical protein
LGIKRVEGCDSPLLDTLLAKEGCPQEIQNLIFDVRGVWNFFIILLDFWSN